MVSSLRRPMVSIGTLASDSHADWVAYTSGYGTPIEKPSPSIAAYRRSCFRWASMLVITLPGDNLVSGNVSMARNAAPTLRHRYAKLPDHRPQPCYAAN